MSCIKGSQIADRWITDGRTVCRDASHFKLANSVINSAEEHETRVEPHQTTVAEEGKCRSATLLDKSLNDDPDEPIQEERTNTGKECTPVKELENMKANTKTNQAEAASEPGEDRQAPVIAKTKPAQIQNNQADYLKDYVDK